MKTTWCCLLLAVGAGAGCIELPFLRDDPKAGAPGAVVGKPVYPAVPVTADQVTEANAYDKAEALRKELQQDAAKDARTTTGSNAQAKILP